MKRFKSKHISYIVGLLLADGLLFGSTDASKVSSLLLITGFLLLLATLYGLIYGLLGLGKLYGLPVPRRRRLAVYLSLMAGILVALQSVGELSTRDVLVLLPLAIIGYFYSAYAAANRRNLAG